MVTDTTSWLLCAGISEEGGEFPSHHLGLSGPVFLKIVSHHVTLAALELTEIWLSGVKECVPHLATHIQL